MSKNVLSIESFAEWAEKQGDREYEWFSGKHCACGQYAAFLGLKDDWLSRATSHRRRAWERLDYFALRGPHTFPALAARLRSSGGQTDG